MAKERVDQYRNTGTEAAPIWEKYYPKTIADAVFMSDSDSETTNIKGYVDGQINSLVNGAPEALDTLKEIADAITANQGVVEGLNAAIGNKANVDHTHLDATTAKSGFMSTGDKAKLDGVSAGAEVNQNAFSSIKAGNVTVEADNKTGTIELVAGNNISLAADAAEDKITIGTTGLSTVATTGSYNDLTDKPEVPGSVEHAISADKLGTARTIALSGGVTGTATPFDGSANITIPVTTVNAATLSGTVLSANLPQASTTASGITKLNSTTTSTAANEAATASAVKAAYDKAAEAKITAEGKSAVMFASSLPSSAAPGTLCFITG